MEQPLYTAFAGQARIVTGDLPAMLTAVKKHLIREKDCDVLIFNDDTGEQFDFDFRGTMEDVLARANPPKARPGPGRPTLGVVSGEVSLLPRHWDWLERQQHNISATIRRLVDDAIRNEPASAKARRALEAADRELWVLAGNLPGCEEASRSLYAKDFDGFRAILKEWPSDIANHLSRLAGRAE